MQRKIFIFIFSLFLMAGCVNVEKEAEDHFRKGEELEANGNFAGAISEYGIIIYKYSESSLVEKAEKSKADCEKEMEIEKTVSIADILVNEKYNDAGLFILRDLINKNPGSYISGEINKRIDSLTGNQAENSLSSAMELQKKGKYIEAIEAYNKILQAFPNSKDKDQILGYISQCEDEIGRQKTLGAQQKKQAEEERKKKELELAEKEKAQKELKKKQSIENALKSLKEKTK
ncbi:MAG: hypothetical protein PHX78_03765 [bacterium]|nr:hypothetical protein [bacterium]